jgi:uncharacterized protein (DUF1778 family)
MAASERIPVYVTPEEKAVFLQAAKIDGESLSNFLASTAVIVIQDRWPHLGKKLGKPKAR